MVKFLLFLILLSGAPVAHAYDLSNPIWGGTHAVTCNASRIPCTFCDGLRVVANIIDGLTFLAIPIAVLVIGYGGFRIMTSGSSSSGVSAGWGAIRSAGIGIVVALGAWLIINTILSLLSGGTGLSGINCSSGPVIGTGQVPGSVGGGSECGQLELTVYDGGASASGAVFSVGHLGQFRYSCTPETLSVVNGNLQKLNTSYQNLRTMLATKGVSVTPGSAFRPKSYQNHFYEIYQKWLRKESDTTLATRCPAQVAKLDQEKNGHRIYLAASADGSNHNKGIGLDLTLSPESAYESVNGWINEWNTSRPTQKIMIRWAGIARDRVHFDLQGGTTNTGC